jgi:5-methylthioadenosine/S-adenosylhomocysteine deaminase
VYHRIADSFGSGFTLYRPERMMNLIRRLAVVSLSAAVILTAGPTAALRAVAAAPTPAILLEGTIVTMNAARDVIQGGRVLVRDGRIAAMWRGATPPLNVDLTDVIRAPLGHHAYIYPGLINLHDHPFYDVLPLWQPPSSHRQAALGRPQGTEPYANRYQWNSAGMAQPEEAVRLITNPSTILTAGSALGRLTEVIKFGKARMILGGTTTTQGGGSDPASESLLARNVEGVNFGRQRIFSRVGAIGSLASIDADALAGAMSVGLVDAWLVHLAEGVRDGDRRPGDPTSSRTEFADLKARHLLTDATVIVHGVGLEPEDFDEMARAPAARADGAGDGRGAKLVWSPLSNLLLYGQTAAVYDALAAGVLVSLGTDWTPSGSPNLLTELKIADRALRDPALLGGRRHIVPGLTVGSASEERGAAERALDRLLVEMVTINPAMAVRWDDQVGSIETGNAADLLVIEAPPMSNEKEGIPTSPYRRLIDATERDVELVMVEGVAQAGDVRVMSALKPGDFEVVVSEDGCFDKAIDVTAPVPNGTETLAQISSLVADGLRALGGDYPPTGGGPSSPFANTWSYLKAHIPGASMLPDLTFTFGLVSFFGLTADAKVNLEALTPPPLFTADDHWWFATLEAVRDPLTGLTANAAAPYAPYPSNANQLTPFGNPFDAQLFHDRWYRGRCTAR